MEPRPYITCRQLIEFIGDYLDGDLDQTARADFERHLSVCRSCRAYLETYRQTTELVHLLGTNEPAEDVPEELVQTILTALRR
jgi:anti-sigma factor RsiW